MPSVCRRHLFIILILLSLTACDSTFWDLSPPPRPSRLGVAAGAAGGAVIGGAASGPPGFVVGGTMGALWGGVVGSIFEHHYTLIDKLIYNGVQVVRVGDEVLLILPSDKFFYTNSPNLRPSYYPVLNMVAELIKGTPKLDVKVAAFTDNVGSWRRNLSLTREQSDHMVKYLWAAGVDTRLMVAAGFGDMDPIASNFTQFGRYQNRRVEITLRKIVPKVLV